MTSSAAHTAGPWKAERGTQNHEGDIVITAAHAGMTSNTPLAHISTILGEEDAVSDARLIAAAPEYDEAARELLALFDFEPGHAEERVPVPGANWTERAQRAALLKLRAAIAKATGGA